MFVPILVVSQTESIGELIRQTLDEIGKYRTNLATDLQQALELAGKVPFSLVIPDLDPPEGTPEGDWPGLLQSVRAHSPSIRLLLILPAGEPEGLAQQLGSDACLSKPFYLPDLVERVSELVEQGNEAGGEAAGPVWASGEPGSFDIPAYPTPARPPAPRADPADLAWLQDVSRAAQHLMRLSLEADAQAALITRGEVLWAYAGQLPQPAAQELAQVVIRAGAHGGPRRGDLARFVRLASGGGEYMLYATRLGSEMVLALAFEAETPFSKIRAQANSLARALAEQPDSETPVASEFNLTASSSAPEAPVRATPGAWDGLEPEEAAFEEDLPMGPLFDPEDVPPPVPTHLAHPGLEEQRPVLASELRADRELRPAHPRAWPPQNETGVPHASEADTQPMRRSSLQGALQTPPGAGPAQEWGLPLVDWPEMHAGPSASQGVDPSLESPVLPGVVPLASGALSSNISLPSAIDAVDEVEPVAFPLPVPVDSLEPGPLEPASPALYSLYYACVLIPRLPRHHLVGPLARRAASWVRQLCLAFGWRLEHLAIRPDYLLWISSVPPHTSPGYMVKMMRRHTSQRIFYEFPILGHENPSGDFWSPGYLVIATPQPPPPQVLWDFVGGTRRQQGEAEPER